MGTIFEYYISTLHGSCEKEWYIYRLAYSRAYMAIFLADACRLKSIGIQAQNQSCKNNKHFYMQTFPSIVFQMFALFMILLKVRKIWAQTVSSSIFPTDSFLLKLVGIDVQ